MVREVHRRLEAALYRRGVDSPAVRTLLLNQAYICLGGFLASLLLTGAGRWAVDFGVGAALISLNFFVLAGMIQRLIFMRKGAVVSLLVSFYFKLFLFGLALFVMIVYAHASVTALLAGLSTVVVNVGIWGGTQIFGHTVKEA